MSRKEHLKKSLGITEYPWSSDDEDPHMSEVNMLLRTTYENRTSVADMPGTSGLQQLPTLPTSPIIPVQRVQVKQERDLYWPLHTHTHTHTHTHAHAHKPIAGTHTCGARMLDIQPISQPFPMPMRSVIHTPAAELREVRPTPAENMQRLFAFKKLTKILPRQNRAANAGTATRATTTRNPVFASTSTPEVTHLTLTKNRAQLALKRLQNSRSTVSWDSHRCASARPEQVQASGGARALRQSTAPAAGETRQLFTMPAAPPPPPPPPIPVVEIEDVPETNTTTPAAEAEVIADASDEPIDVEISNNSSNGGVSLEEEIVEIDAPDETEANATTEENNNNNNDNVVSSVVVLNEGAAATNEVDATDGLQSPERKRKREASNSFTAPEEGEPVTVKEFNQSLLRLLECPVCLEWMEPPMSQCRRGHLVCGRCRARLASCPVCRTTFSSVRNRAMEGVSIAPLVHPERTEPMAQCRRGHLVCGRCRARLASCPVCRTTFSSVRNRAMEGVSIAPLVHPERTEPMAQCRRGHLVCGRCRARLASCPVCRTTFSSVRNRAMEGVSIAPLVHPERTEPMAQCRRGHLVCGRCRARLASCPVCRTTFSSVRNRAMEGVSIAPLVHPERTEPMAQCRRGHLVCGRCRARLASCPVCRTTFSSVRNRAMEGVSIAPLVHPERTEPMAQCRRGHLVCGRCRARLASCPVCRTTFSSVRNRAMEGVAEMVRYPCRHGCGREVRLRRRAAHEASCEARRYNCPAPGCADRAPLPRDSLHQHFQVSG
ncbi:uncharacterized protein LOC135088549 isoform X2 [Ostrinia nubilalis]|uniref:uncharacterized protein LOC135088549 isoform X2 n=1 Tax=Ostrinia nubilalis TaxID=29057 RepID=UPI0030824B51